MPFSIGPRLVCKLAYCRPTMPPPNSLVCRSSSLAARTIPAESGGYDATKTASGLVAWMALMIGVKSVVLGGYDSSYTICSPASCALTRMPPSAFLGYSASAPTTARV